MSKIVAIIDPFKGGHHEAFVKLFSKVFVEKGSEVWVFSPIESRYLHQDELLRNEFENGRLQTIFYAHSTRKITRLGMFSDGVKMLLDWKDLDNLLRKTERAKKKHISFVYFAWIDTFLANYLMPGFLDFLFRRKWAGLYFHPRHLRLHEKSLSQVAAKSDIDYVFTSKNCVAIHIHDREIKSKMETRLGNKVTVLPETADATSPDPDHPVAKKINSMAGGRSVIGIIGLSHHQGLMHLLRLAKIAPPEKYFFVFAGAEYLDGMNKKDQDEWEVFKSSDIENCFFHLERLNEGSEYNSVFNSLDYPFLVYDNFGSSSNRLTKAAIMRKLVLAQKEFCIGEDVDRFKLGVTVDDRRPVNLLKALTFLSENREMLLRGAEFEAYASLNSYQALVSCLGEINDLID